MTRCEAECCSFSAKITALRKAVPKNDKKKKKETTDEICRLESELREKHERELSEMTSTNGKDHSVESKADSDRQPESEEFGASGQELSPEYENTKISRAQRKRDKKALQRKEQQQRIEEESQELEANSQRKYEQEIMDIILKREKLKIYDIPSDGDCLYKAIEHQLSLRGKKTTVSELRKVCADQLRKRKDEFLPFLISPDNDDVITDEGFIKYCEQVEKTKCWGGDIEIKALSYALCLPVKVIQAFGSHVEIAAEDYKNSEPLLLSYHRHAFQLGEHYNSLIQSNS